MISDLPSTARETDTQLNNEVITPIIRPDISPLTEFIDHQFQNISIKAQSGIHVKKYHYRYLKNSNKLAFMSTQLPQFVFKFETEKKLSINKIMYSVINKKTMSLNLSTTYWGFFFLSFWVVDNGIVADDGKFTVYKIFKNISKKFLPELKLYTFLESLY
ncbi:hypothetical protein BpHYR1_053803 [Brachionus plicatilis]|uniref:Uncharacterized protein n=1 Tax=Brachionus plicatilis TaxID=10195 RepID=A0A3M7TAV0_BRAPC|nr:hypothetical protein BpHYR1_053803 [Brachionus plicatilis]